MKMISLLRALVLPAFLGAALAQDLFPPALSRNNTFNTTHGQYTSDSAAALIATANLSAAQSAAVLVATEFERSNWAGGSARLDPFYTSLPANGTSSSPGHPLKVEENTDTKLYTLPPGVSLSRLLFTTRTLNGSTVPASAFVLWPFSARASGGDSAGAPLVAWGHGTSGWSAECAPSHIRNLWYQYSAPFTLALQGYVVVAPDYAGLGVERDGAGEFVAHQYGANPAAGADLVFAARAALRAWPGRLGGEYVVMGHSQGGGAAWAAAELLAQEPAEAKGYLGTVAASPLVSFADLANAYLDNPLVLGSGLAKIATGMNSVFPDFKLGDWLSEKGVRTTEVLQELSGCQSVSLELQLSPDLLREGWNETYYLPAFDALTRISGRGFAGPMLVIQGTEDLATPEPFTTAAVDASCTAVSGEKIEYVRFEGVSHVPVLYAGQQHWLGWIADRFDRVPLQDGCTKETVRPLRDTSAYQKELALVLQYPLFAYETA